MKNIPLLSINSCGTYENPLSSRPGPHVECSPLCCKFMIDVIPFLQCQIIPCVNNLKYQLNPDIHSLVFVVNHTGKKFHAQKPDRMHGSLSTHSFPDPHEAFLLWEKGPKFTRSKFFYAILQRLNTMLLRLHCGLFLVTLSRVGFFKQ